MTLAEARVIVEGLIFAAERPLSAKEIGEIIGLDQPAVEALVEEIRRQHMSGALAIRMVAGGYQMVTKPELAPWIEKLGRPVVHAPLSAAATETLAIIAYEQPITRAEIEQIRGVRSDSALTNLLDRGLICEVGRKEGPGRPILYGVTDKFLEHFGLRSIEELPLKSIGQ
ncbi:MAG TPA: SMC-Scp complex subunit ScpB [Firmicutes bacterium]|jgi:segregation and condensation protein B|nr:SMC-Scp complex subunit ScpB [Bacillota bacterium]